MALLSRNKSALVHTIKSSAFMFIENVLSGDKKKKKKKRKRKRKES